MVKQFLSFLLGMVGVQKPLKQQKCPLSMGCHVPKTGCPYFFVTLPETNSSHLKIGLNAPKGNGLVFQPSIFRCENLSFREGRPP